MLPLFYLFYYRLFIFINKNNTLFNQGRNMKESRSCHTCQRHYYNLMSANCGHKICFHCVKTNRNTNKCANCIQQPVRPRTALISPSRNISNDTKQRSTKMKEGSDSKIISQCSPAPMQRSRQSFHRSQINWAEEDHQNTSIPSIKCKEHHEPLTMYCKSAKELVCSVCVCSKTKLNGDIVPLRLAQEYLKKETKINREEAKVILGNIQNAHKVMSKNNSIFENSYKNGMKTIETIFDQMKNDVQAIQKKTKQEFMTFFQSKFKECEQVVQDLTYLNSILRQYRQSNNKQNMNFNELVYMFTSFKLIRGTIKNLNLDYIPYLKDVNLVQINRYHYRDPIKDYVKLKFDLPLKFGERTNKQKSFSNKSASKSKNQEWDEIYRGGFTGKVGKDGRGSISKKHQMSLCNNVHGIQMGDEQKNLYKMLLKTKFKL